jgi:hypothetical protein
MQQADVWMAGIFVADLNQPLATFPNCCGGGAVAAGGRQNACCHVKEW